MEAPVCKEAVVKYVLMGDYYIDLPIKLAHIQRFPQGAYLIYKGRKFDVIDPISPEFDNNTGGYKYSLRFEAQQNHMKRFPCFWLEGPNPEAVFHNTTDLESFGNLIVANMNKALGVENWKMGALHGVELPEKTKLVSFNGDSCWDALTNIAETFEVEWWTTENDATVTLHFGKLESGTPETFRRGEVVQNIPARKGNDDEYGTRFYVFGSNRNLTKEYGQAGQGGITNHVSEIRLRLPDGQQYIDAHPDLAANEVVAKVVFFEDIYPKNTETITSISTIDRTIIEGRTDKAYIMYCEDTPFLPSDVIEGETLAAHFETGDLAGRDFELALLDENNQKIDPTTWKPEDGFAKKFEIIAEVETSGESQLIIPNDNLRPRGADEEQGPDKFILTGVKLPEDRIREAEEELLKVGTSYAKKHSSDTNVYDCTTNPVYCTLNDKNYEAGQAVLLMDPRFGENGRLSRVQGYEKKLYNEYIATYTIGDNTPYSRLGNIESDIHATLYSKRIGITAEGISIYLITRYDNTTASDVNAYSAKRALWEFANKQTSDTFNGTMTFEKRSVHTNGVQFGGDFASGLTGFGGLIDGAGNAELQNITVRESLTVPSLNYNRVDISVGDDWSAPGGGIVAEADPTGQLVTLKLEEGEIGAVKAGDICMGIFHSPIASENASEDKDDGRGNRTFAGFATSYFRITEVLGDRNERFRYELRPVSERYPRQISPMAAMKFVAYGSFTDAARRTSRYSTRTYQRYLRNVSDWEFTGENIAAQFGDLSNLALFGLQMSGYSAYLDNIYLQGLMRSLDGTFVIDTKTKSLLLASSESGMGIAYNPEQGFVQGKIYDPATGRFQKEFDLDAIEQTASNAEQTAAASQQAADAASRKAQEAKDYIDNTLPGEFARINEKLDGVVENWFYAYTPTLQNDPAASWIRDGEQAQHEGDTFTNTQPYVDAQTTPDAGKSWRWVKSGEAYEWTPIADSDAVKALREAAKAQETADGKSRTFVVQPAPPYDVGDLWMQGPSGDVMRCIKSRQTGAFDASDWDKASKYTDDTLARDAKQTARTAQETADKAKASAEAATGKLATWASDSYISPQEKTALRQQQKDIQSEHAEITAQASKYSVPATDYTAAYNAANAALAKYTASTPESIAVGADYANIAAYYTARETILDAIAAAAKAYSERLVSEVQPVGENLLRHTKDFTKGWTGKGESVAETYNGLTVYYGKSTVDYKEIRQQEVSLLPSTEYTLSFWAKGVGQVISYCWPYVNEEIIATNGTAAGYTGRDTYCPYDLTTEWKRYWVTFRTYSEAKGGNVLFRVMVGNEAYVCGAKLAQGNKGIVWTASPEDAEYSGVNIIDNTESRTIGAGDNDYAQTGFAVGAVAVGDQFALSVGSIDLLAGTATGFTDQLYDYSANVALADAATLTADSRTAVYTVTRAADKAHLILYAGRWGSTAGNTVRYEKVMLVRGNKPEPSWSPSTADRQAEIDNLRPASVNILPDSAALTTDANGGPWDRNGAGPVNETYEGYSSLVIRNMSTKGAGVYVLYPKLEMPDETECVVSVWVHASRVTDVALGWESEDNVRQNIPAEAVGKWYRISRVQKRPAKTNFVCFVTVNKGDTVAFRNIMCSAGNMLTEWSPSVEDVQKQIDQAKIAADNLEYLKKAFENDDTIEYGGLYLASFLGVKNSAKAVVAGITGKNFLTGQDFAPDDRSCPMIFAGAASAADANSAKFRVYPNGATYAEEAYIKGTITATAGSFGDFKVDGLYLISSHDTTHGIKIGDGMVYSWNADSYAEMVATGVSLGEIMPTGQGFTSAAAQFVAKVNEEIPYEASVAYYAYMRNTYGKKAYAFLANAGDIETLGGAIQGHIHYRTMSITGTGHMIGGAVAGKEQMFVMKNTARASIYLPPSVSARIGEIYYVVQCSTSGTYILPNRGSSDKIKDSDGTIITRHTLSANQSCSVMWDGAYWRILPF